VKALAIAATDLRRLVRWRPNLFFLFLLPMMIILLLGAAFGGSATSRIGVAGGDGGPLARRFVAALDGRPATRVRKFTTVHSLQEAVAHGDLDAGLVIPRTYDRRVQAGASVTIDQFARPDSAGQQLRATVQSVAAGQSRLIAAAQLVAVRRHIGFGAAFARVRQAARATPRVLVLLTDTEGARYTGTSGRFENGASTELVLFIFLTSLTGASALIETRRLGIARRILATPTSTGTIIAGQMLARFCVALVQALIIIAGSVVFFGVGWGDPLGTAAVVLAFCLVSTGVAVLLGCLFRNEQQSRSVAFLLGLGLAALGGSMAPLEVFPSTARTIAHVTPHAWANDAFSKLLRHGGNLGSVLPQVGVLLGFAAVALVIATWRLRRALTA
jgi:ABC-2 type transport system permease protein